MFDNVLFGIKLAIVYPILCLLILTSPIWVLPVYLIFPPVLAGELETIQEDVQFA